MKRLIRQLKWRGILISALLIIGRFTLVWAGNVSTSIQDTGTNVGSRTLGRCQKLEVSIGSGNSGTIATFNAPTYDQIDIGVTANTGQIGTKSTSPLALRVNSSEKMRIQDNGNVGIGTTGPGQKLEVSIGSGNSGTIATFNAPTYDQIDIGVTANTGQIGTKSTSPLALRVNSSEKMRIQDNGNVDIGTTGPGQKLEVSIGSGNSGTIATFNAPTYDQIDIGVTANTGQI